MKRAVFPIVLLWLASRPASAETWAPFPALIEDTDYAARYEELVRDGKVVGRRRTAVYWQKKGFEKSEPAGTNPAAGPDLREIAWSREDFRRGDSLKTWFVFYGRGQHLWTAIPQKGAVVYPGWTAHRRPGEELVVSPVEFHEVLKLAAARKRANEGRRQGGSPKPSGPGHDRGPGSAENRSDGAVE